MRAIFYSFNESSLNSTIEIKDEAAHHLNVIRIRAGETLLLLNGKGVKVYTKVINVEKRAVLLEIYETKTEHSKKQISLAIATPKKDAFEDILKMAVELGVESIQPISSKYSQYDFASNERSERLLESALIQSNNPWLPLVSEQKTLEQFLMTISSPLFFFNSQSVDNAGQAIPDFAEKFHILIGPEGGFSTEETALILSNPKTIQVHLPTPILRAPTAVCTSVGYLLALQNQR